MNLKIIATIVSFAYMSALGCIALKETVGLEGWETLMFVGCVVWLAASSLFYGVMSGKKREEGLCLGGKPHQWKYPRIGVRDCTVCKAHEYMMVDPTSSHGRWIGIHHIGKLSDE